MLRHSLFLMAMIFSAGAGAEDALRFKPANGAIAYAWTNLHWAIYQTESGKSECPEGFNEGNREQFKKLYPESGPKRTLAGTQLQWEIESWYPTLADDGFKFLEARGPTALGFNLDGKVGPNDFTSPEGEPGIDNQLYRALGCIKNYRGPDGAIQFFDDEEIGKDLYNRLIIEVTGVDDLANSPSVEVTLYRGRDALLYDGTGKKVVPGGSQRIDTRWGGRFIQRLHGSIKDGVLTTEPKDIVYPWAPFNLATDEYMRAARLRLKLTPTTAEGLIGGYADVESWYLQMMKNWSTHHQNYGQTSAPALYRAMRRLADAYPDPKTGVNTAISSALRASFTQVIIVPSSRPPAQMLAAQHPMQPYRGPPDPRPPQQPTAAVGEHAAAVAGTN